MQIKQIISLLALGSLTLGAPILEKRDPNVVYVTLEQYVVTTVNGPAVTQYVTAQNGEATTVIPAPNNVIVTKAITTTSEQTTSTPQIIPVAPTLTTSSVIDDSSLSHTHTISPSSVISTIQLFSTSSTPVITLQTSSVASIELPSTTIVPISTTTVQIYDTTTISVSLSSSQTPVSTPVSTIQVVITSSVNAASSATAASSAVTTGTIIPKQLTYSPYNNDNSCKDAAAVLADLTIIKGKGINSIRMYGVDCDSINTVQPAAASLGLTISQGFYITSAGVDSIDADVTSLIAYGAANGWGIFADILVGNEAIINGWITADQLISKISSVRSQLSAAGYSGAITTAETPNVYQENPALCDALDFIGINAHAYFDPSASAATAGQFVASQIAVTQLFCPGKRVYVTETGYPSAGIQNGGNIPSVANQAIAINSIIDVVGTDLTLFTLYNDFWKSPGPYGVEQYFGILSLLG